MSYEDAAFESGDGEGFKILCPFCSAPYDAKMSVEYDYAGESEETGRWGEEITTEIYCSNCKRLIYKKNQ